MSLVNLVQFETSERQMEAENLKLIARVRKEFDRGYQRGLTDMKEDYQTKTEAKAREIASGIRRLSTEVGAIALEVESQAGDLAASAIKSVLPELARRGLASEMAMAVRELVSQLEPPRLHISGPEVLIDALKEQLDHSDLSGSPLPLHLETDREADDGHARLEWPAGQVEFSHGDMLERVTNSLNTLMIENRPEIPAASQEGAPS